jgi:two-component system NarL family response regulator
VISLLVVDDHKVVRAGLIALLSLQPDLRIAGEAADGEEAVREYRRLQPDVVLMDLKMPGGDGWRATAAIRREFPGSRILVFSTLIGDEHVYRAIQAGALGYVMKEAEEEELVAAIRATAAGRRAMPAVIAAALDRRLAAEPLTGRELDILRRVAAGMSNRETGESLGLTENTVKGYLKSIAAKLDAPDRTAAAMIAVQRGLIELPPP